MTATHQLRAWQRAHPGRKVHWAGVLIAMADGHRSVFATGADTEASAKAVLEAWYALPIGGSMRFSPTKHAWPSGRFTIRVDLMSSRCQVEVQ